MIHTNTLIYAREHSEGFNEVWIAIVCGRSLRQKPLLTHFSETRNALCASLYDSHNRDETSHESARNIFCFTRRKINMDLAHIWYFILSFFCRKKHPDLLKRDFARRNWKKSYEDILGGKFDSMRGWYRRKIWWRRILRCLRRRKLFFRRHQPCLRVLTPSRPTWRPSETTAGRQGTSSRRPTAPAPSTTFSFTR